MFIILDPRSQRAGSYKFGAVIVNVKSVSQSVSELVSYLTNFLENSSNEFLAFFHEDRES